MVLTSLIWFGIDATLNRGLVAIGSLTKHWAQSILQRVSDHFTLSSQDLGVAFQGGFASGVSAIAQGMAPAGWLDAALAKPGQALSPKLAKMAHAMVVSRHDDLARLVVTQIGQSGLVLPARVIDFPCHEGLSNRRGPGSTVARPRGWRRRWRAWHAV